MSRTRVWSLEVLWRLDGTTNTDNFHADYISITRFDGGRTIIDLRRGRDDTGPVKSITYERTYRTVVRRAKS